MPTKLQQKKQVIKKMKENEVQMWIGLDLVKVEPICNTGLTNLRLSDKGIFGAGIYLSSFANYAREYAIRKFMSPVLPNSRGEHVVILYTRNQVLILVQFIETNLT